MKPERQNELENSAEILTKLEKEAAETHAKAKAQAARVAAMTLEFERLPEIASQAANKLGAVASERKKLGATLENEFEDHYRRLLSGNLSVTLDVDCLTARILSRELRLGVINRIEADVNSELRSLDKKNKELARALGRKPYQLAK